MRFAEIASRQEGREQLLDACNCAAANKAKKRRPAKPFNTPRAVKPIQHIKPVKPVRLAEPSKPKKQAS